MYENTHEKHQDTVCPLVINTYQVTPLVMKNTKYGYQTETKDHSKRQIKAV